MRESQTFSRKRSMAVHKVKSLGVSVFLGVAIVVSGLLIWQRPSSASTVQRTILASIECHKGPHLKVSFYRYKPERCAITDEFGSRKVILKSMKWKRWNSRHATGRGIVDYYYRPGHEGRAKVRLHGFEGGCGFRRHAHQFAVVHTLSGPERGDRYEYLLSPGPICSALQ